MVYISLSFKTGDKTIFNVLMGSEDRFLWRKRCKLQSLWVSYIKNQKYYLLYFKYSYDKNGILFCFNQSFEYNTRYWDGFDFLSIRNVQRHLCRSWGTICYSIENKLTAACLHLGRLAISSGRLKTTATKELVLNTFCIGVLFRLVRFSSIFSLFIASWSLQ